MKTWFKALTEEQAAYLVALLFVLILSIIKRFIYLFNVEFNNYAFAIPLVTSLYGFANFIVPSFIKFTESKLGKSVISFLVILGGLACLGAAKQFINLSFEVPSSAFEHTQSFVSILFVPIFLAFLISLLGITLMPVMMISSFQTFSVKSIKDIVLFERESTLVEVNPLTGIFRFCLYIAIVSFFFNSVNKLNWYLEEVQQAASYVAFEFDSELFSHCKKNENEKVAYIDESNIVLSTKTADNKIKFFISKCN